eukprot:jgi/Chlat1/4644/Chrsp3S05598
MGKPAAAADAAAQAPVVEEQAKDLKDVKDGSSEWTVGKLCFAKVSGHPSWPARLVEPAEYGRRLRAGQRLVLFFGTQEIGVCSLSALSEFTDENKAKYLAAKRTDPNALEEVETYLHRAVNSEVDEMHEMLTEHQDTAKRKAEAGMEQDSLGPPSKRTKLKTAVASVGGIPDQTGPEVAAQLGSLTAVDKGRRLRFLDPESSTWCCGVFQKQDLRKKHTAPHMVLVDGETKARWLELSKLEWSWLEPDKGMDINASCPMPAAGLAEVTEECPKSEQATQSSDVTQRLGHRLRVYWADDKAWYTGRLTKVVSSRKKPHHILYDDGEDEWVQLEQEKVKWLDPAPASARKAGQTVLASSRTVQKQSQNPDQVEPNIGGRKARDAAIAPVQAATLSASAKQIRKNLQPSTLSPVVPGPTDAIASEPEALAGEQSAATAAITAVSTASKEPPLGDTTLALAATAVTRDVKESIQKLKTSYANATKKRNAVLLADTDRVNVAGTNKSHPGFDSASHQPQLQPAVKSVTARPALVFSGSGPSIPVKTACPASSLAVQAVVEAHNSTSGGPPASTTAAKATELQLAPPMSLGVPPVVTKVTNITRLPPRLVSTAFSSHLAGDSLDGLSPTTAAEVDTRNGNGAHGQPLQWRRPVHTTQAGAPAAPPHAAELDSTLSSLHSMIDTLSKARDSIDAAARCAFRAAGLGAAEQVLRMICKRMERQPNVENRLALFYLVDCISQTCNTRGEEVSVAVRKAVCKQLGSMLAFVAPPGKVGRENRRQCTKILALWKERTVLPVSEINHHLSELQKRISEDSLSSAPDRTQQQAHTNSLQGEDMLSNEYGTFQVPGLRLARLDDDLDGPDSPSQAHDHQPAALNISSMPPTQTPSPEPTARCLAAVDTEVEMEVEGDDARTDDSTPGQLHSPPPLPDAAPPPLPPMPDEPPPPPPPFPDTHALHWPPGQPGMQYPPQAQPVSVQPGLYPTGVQLPPSRLILTGRVHVLRPPAGHVRPMIYAQQPRASLVPSVGHAVAQFPAPVQVTPTGLRPVRPSRWQPLAPPPGYPPGSIRPQHPQDHAQLQAATVLPK